MIISYRLFENCESFFVVHAKISTMSQICKFNCQTCIFQTQTLSSLCFNPVLKMSPLKIYFLFFLSLELDIFDCAMFTLYLKISTVPLNQFSSSLNLFPMAFYFTSLKKQPCFNKQCCLLACLENEPCFTVLFTS